MLHYIMYRHLSDYRLFDKFWGYVDEMKHEVSMQYENLRNFAALQNVKFNSSQFIQLGFSIFVSELRITEQIDCVYF